MPQPRVVLRHNIQRRPHSHAPHGGIRILRRHFLQRLVRLALKPRVPRNGRARLVHNAVPERGQTQNSLLPPERLRILPRNAHSGRQTRKPRKLGKRRIRLPHERPHQYGKAIRIHPHLRHAPRLSGADKMLLIRLRPAHGKDKPRHIHDGRRLRRGQMRAAHQSRAETALRPRPVPGRGRPFPPAEKRLQIFPQNPEIRLRRIGGNNLGIEIGRKHAHSRLRRVQERAHPRGVFSAFRKKLFFRRIQLFKQPEMPRRILRAPGKGDEGVQPPLRVPDGEHPRLRFGIVAGRAEEIEFAENLPLPLRAEGQRRRPRGKSPGGERQKQKRTSLQKNAHCPTLS